MKKSLKAIAVFPVVMLLLSGCSTSESSTEPMPEASSTVATESSPELKTQHWCWASADFIAGNVPAEKVWEDYISDKGIVNTVLLSRHLDLALNIMSSQDESYHEDTVLDSSDEDAREALFDGIRFAQGQTKIPAETWASLESANAYCTDPALGLPQSGLTKWQKLMDFVAAAK